MAATNRVKYLATDIWDTPDDGKRYEVIGGELFVSPSPSWLHQYALMQLALLVGNWVFQHALGKVVQAPLGIVLDEEDGVQPDLIYISRERDHIITERGIESAPDLLVEVLSPSTASRDRGIKMRRYANAAVPHYWMLDPGGRALEAYKLGDNGYELLGTFGVGETFRPELFAGLELPIDRLWA
jgi:Uma2 family endonuclease